MMLMDRMKLRSEFYLNPKTNQCVGLAVDSASRKICLSDEVHKLLLEDENDSKDDSDDSAFSCSLMLINLDLD